MISRLAKRKSINFLSILLCLQLAVYFTIFFNIPVARQVIGFLYLTFVPGIVIIKLLRLDEIDGSGTILLSVGLSIAFLMFEGLLINEICPVFGITEPLSTTPLMITLNVLIFISGTLACLRRGGMKLWEAKTLNLHPLVPLFIMLPILSVVGTMWVNAFGSNLFLLLMIIATSLLFVFAVVSKNLWPQKLYAIPIFMIAISLLYHSSLISNYVVSFGSDVPLEYFVFKTAQVSARWGSIRFFWDLGYGRVNAMLSVTILPVVYSSVLNIDPTWVLKILFPLIFSFVPLGLYEVLQVFVGKKYAFISVFLFMAYETFYTEMMGLNRQMVAELFFVLLLLATLNKEMKTYKRIVCFISFSFGLVASHYGVAEIFLLFIFLEWISLVVIKRPGKKITASMVALFFVIMFSWHIYTSNSAIFKTTVEYGNHVYNQLDDFFNPTLRERMVLRGLGVESPPTIWSAIGRAFAYSTQALILLGFIGLVTKRINVPLEREYFMLTTIAMAFLAALIAVPGLANTLNMTRFYHVLLFFLAPLCVLGAEFLVKLVSKRGTEVGVSFLLVIVLVPYFLFQTSFMYEVTGSPSWSMPLSMHRMDTFFLRRHGYFDECDVYGALWMSKCVAVQHAQIYADPFSRNNVLTIYGMMYRGDVYELSNTTTVATNGTVYLSTLNVVDGKIVSTYGIWKSSELSFLFNDLNKVYSNGGSEVYNNIP